MARSRFFTALIFSALAHSAMLSALLPGKSPMLRGTPDDVLHVSLMAPLRPSPGMEAAGGRDAAPVDEPGNGDAELLYGHHAPAQSDSRAVFRVERDHDSAREPVSAATIARVLRAQVSDAFRLHFDYPPLARQNGWEGEVRLGLRVESNGELARIRVLASSGYGILDRAAMRSLKAVNRLPRATELLQGGACDLVLPVRYRLLDS